MLILIIAPITAFVVPVQSGLQPVSLFGGGNKQGGALSNVAGVVDQFKKAQQIAKKSQEMQAELTSQIVEGKSADGMITFSMTGQQIPVSCTMECDYDDAATASESFTSALKNAQDKSLELMNTKMQALYAEMGLGGAPA